MQPHGEILFDGKNLVDLDRKSMRALRQKIQVIFQDPYSSLNPRMKIGEIISEPMMVHRTEPDKAARDARVKELLRLCGLDPRFADRYPHEMSGGQRQRVGIARALSVRPEFIICDEAISALDVSIQAQIINLLEDLRDQFDLTYLFIAHDLSVVRHLCHRVAVMYLGRIVELADCDELYGNPMHPYTRALLGGGAGAGPGGGDGRVPTRSSKAKCRVRSIRRADACSIRAARSPSPSARRTVPEFRELKPGHWVACSVV